MWHDYPLCLLILHQNSIAMSAAIKGQCPSGVSEIICYTRLFVCKAP